MSNSKLKKTIFQKMAIYIAIFFILLLVFFWGQLKNYYSTDSITKKNITLSEMEEKGVPIFDLKTVAGDEFDLKSLEGKLLFVNFWASWCDPCVREFPSMLKLVEHFKGDLVLIAISNDSEKEDLDNFINAFNLKQENVYVLWDKDRRVSSSYGTQKLPETFMIGSELKLIRKIVGIENWYSPSSIQYLSGIIDSIKAGKIKTKQLKNK